MYPGDILGVHLQAYWNRLDGATGTVTRLTNSHNHPHPQISVHWASSRQWGYVAGEEGAMDRMYDGLIISHGTNEATAQTVTFSNVPPSSHTLLLYTVQYPLDSFSIDVQALTFKADGSTASMRQGFIRPQNFYEYRDSGGFVVVTSDTPETRGVGNTLRLDNLQPGDGRIHVRFFSPDWAEPPPPSDRATGPGLNGLQLVLNPRATQPFRHDSVVHLFDHPRIDLHGGIHRRSKTADHMDAAAARHHWNWLQRNRIGFGCGSDQSILPGSDGMT